ncbi:MAG: hypothetical protein U0R44_04265 [Candidatus Micrarchaeia archaeon]
MAKTFSEIRDELRSLKDEIFMSGENADMKLVASYLDRLVLSVDSLAETLEGLEASMEQIGSCCESCEDMTMAKSKPKAKAKPKKKSPAKKKRK